MVCGCVYCKDVEVAELLTQCSNKFGSTNQVQLPPSCGRMHPPLVQLSVSNCPRSVAKCPPLLLVSE